MPDKKIDLSGFDEAVAVQPTKTIDLSGFDEAVKKNEEPVSFGGSEPSELPSVPTESKPLSSTPDREIRIDGTVGEAKPTISPLQEANDNYKKTVISSVKDEKEKKAIGTAIDNANSFFAGMGGMTPIQKLSELNRKMKELDGTFNAESVAKMDEKQMLAFQADYTNKARIIANELGLNVSAEGDVSIPENEKQMYQKKLADYIETEKSKQNKDIGFWSNLGNKLSSGVETAGADVIDMVGIASGLNYFQSFKSLSEGKRLVAEGYSSKATKYDGDIEGYVRDGKLGDAAGLAVSSAIESLPAMIPMFMSPTTGLYTMSATSAVNKYRQIENANVPEWQKVYNAVLSGAAEFAGDKLVTIPILTKSKQAILALGRDGGREAIESAVKKSFESQTSKVVLPSFVTEGLSEVATGLSQDLTDKVTTNPKIKIGATAIDNFTVGAIMGKVFALPQDVVKFRDRKQARDFATQVLDKLPADMDIETKINLGWKMAERDKLQEAENKLDEKFKGKYATQLVTLNSEIDGIAEKYLGKAKVEEIPELSVGKMDETGDEQGKLDYLKANGVKVPDGTTMEQLNVLYDETKSKGVKQTAAAKTGTKVVGEQIVEENKKEDLVNDIEKRRQDELNSISVTIDNENKGVSISDTGTSGISKAIDDINAKYDAELKSLEATTKKQEPVVVGEQRMSQIEEELISEREKPQVDEVKVKSLQDEFNTLEKEAEKQEWESVFNVPVEKATEAIDNLIKKEKEKPNGFGSFIDKKDARESKEVVAKYSDTSKLSDADVVSDFTDALRGNPTSWYADGLKLRESIVEASKRGISTDELIKKAVDLYVKDGFSEKEAKATVSSMIEPILKGVDTTTKPSVAIDPISEPIEPQTKQKGVVVPSETKVAIKQQKEVVVGVAEVSDDKESDNEILYSEDEVSAHEDKYDKEYDLLIDEINDELDKKGVRSFEEKSKYYRTDKRLVDNNNKRNELRGKNNKKIKTILEEAIAGIDFSNYYGERKITKEIEQNFKKVLRKRFGLDVLDYDYTRNLKDAFNGNELEGIKQDLINEFLPKGYAQFKDLSSDKRDVLRKGTEKVVIDFVENIAVKIEDVSQPKPQPSVVASASNKSNDRVNVAVEPRSAKKALVVPSEIKVAEKQQKEVVGGASFDSYGLETPNAKIENKKDTGDPNSFKISDDNDNSIIGLMRGASFGMEPASNERGQIFNIDVKEKRKGIGTSLMLDALLNMKKNGTNLVNFVVPSEEGLPFNKRLEEKGYIKKIREDVVGGKVLGVEYEITDKVLEQQKQPIVGEQQIDNSQLNLKENGKETSQKADGQGRKEKLLEKNKKADDLLAEGLSDIADLLGTKLSLTGEQRVKVKDAVRKVAKGMILKGEVKAEQLAIAIKDYFSKAGHDISDDLINEALKEEQDAKAIREGNKGDVGTQKGVVEGAQGKLPVGNDVKDQKTPRSEGEVKQRGFQTGSMEKRGGVFAEIAKEHPLYYNEKSENQQLKDAADWLDGKDEATIISSVTSAKKTGTIEQRVNRKILVAMYLQDKINKFVAEGKLEEADATHENLIKVTDSLAKEGTEIAQGLQAYAKFQRLTPDAVAWTVNNEIRKQNQSKFPETDLKAVEESEKEIDKMSTDISHEALESERLSKVIETIADKNKGSKQEKTNAEKAKEIADKLRKVKSSNWGITLAADPISSIGIGVLDGAVELTAKSIEVSGNIADSISKGIKKIKNSEWYKSLSADQKRKIERLFEVNVKKDIGVDSLSKGQLAKYLKTEIKDLKVSIKDVINKHWTDPNTMGITLSERIISDLGLSKAEADLVEKTMSEIIRDMLDGKVVDYISGEALPKSKAQKSLFLDKMRDFLMVGKMDEKIYRDIFAQKFGLTPDITKEEVTLITNLNKAVQATKNMGVFGDIVANEFAREIDKLIPKTRLQELFGGMIGLDYANALFGYTTHYVNIKSVFFNLLARPIMDVTRLEDWIDAARRGEISQLPIMNVFNAWSDFAKAMGHGTTDFADIIKSGDLRAMHKYISEVKSIANLNVPELERHTFGKDRFKNIEFKGIDVNAANYMKYVGRALAAEDAFNYRGFEAVELASALRKKMQKEGFTDEQIKEQVNKQVYGMNLSEAESKEIEAQLAKEKANMASFGFKTDRFKDNRRRLELVREKLLNFDEAELTDLREVAKGSVFNDTRGGIVNSVMGTMSRFANKNIFTKLTTMPHFMFFRIAGNIGDFSIDTIPAYGTLRSKGYTPTTMFATYMKHRADGMSGEKAAFNAIFGKRLSVSELPWKTAQLGDKGSYRYKQQQDRARIGNLMLLTQVAVVMGLYAIGGDDKDENGEPWFDISGGRFFDKDVYGREAKLMPPYTIKIGGWKWRYGNAPIMTFGMSVLGNYADMVKAGLPEEEISARVKLMSRSFLYSIGALTDQQLMQGFKSMFQSVLDLVKNAGAIKANDESGENKPVKTITNSFLKYVAKEQLSPLTAWLPTKNNLFQQSLQTYMGTAVESKDIPAMLAYDVGIHHFTNNKALDVLGNEVKRKPGYTGIYYEPAMIRENPKAWAMTRWLQDNNSYPANYYNRDEKYVYATPKSKGWLKDIFDEKKPSYESKTPTEDEFWQMRKLTGEMISKDLQKYKEAEYNGKKVWEIEANEKSSNGKTAMQEKVSKYVSEAKQQTRLYLFTWKELGRSDPKLLKTLYENKALPAYETKVPVYKRDQSGSIYMDENNEVVIRDKRDLMDESLSSFNADAFKDYFERMKGVKTTNPTELKLLSDIMWKTAVQTKAAMYTGE